MKLIQDLSDSEMLALIEETIVRIENGRSFICHQMVDVLQLHNGGIYDPSMRVSVNEYIHPLLVKHGFRTDGVWRRDEETGKELGWSEDADAERIAFLSALADGFREQTEEN